MQAFADGVWVCAPDRRPAWLDAVHRDDRERAEGLWADAVRERSRFAFDFRSSRGHQLEVRGAPVVDDDGTVLEWAGWFADLSDLQRRLVEERTLAEQLQRAVLPEEIPDIPGLTASVRYLPAELETGVGGDWYDVLPLPGDTILVAIGDVCGRGLEAADAMVQLRSALRAYAVQGVGPGQLLERLSAFAAQLRVAEFVTVCAGLLDPATGHLVYANAGHLPPLVVHADGQAELLWGDTGPPIGSLMGTYEQRTVQLEPGAALVLYTDGLVEERRRPLDATLEDLRARAAGVGGPDLAGLTARLLEQHPADDDVALLVVRRDEAVAEEVRRRFPAEVTAVGAMRREAAEVAARCGFDDDALGRIKLAVSEAATNALVHAYRDEPEPGELELRVRPGATELEIVVADFGNGMRPREDSPGIGLGLGLIAAMSTRMEIVSSSDGTEVHMAFAS